MCRHARGEGQGCESGDENARPDAYLNGARKVEL
jgi:hypothetical protein